MIERSKQDVIEARINEIARENRGRLSPELVLLDAAEPASPLHQCFEWDDSKAANQFRLDQARALIRSVRVVITTETRKIATVAYVRDPDAGPEQGYIAVASLRKTRDKALQAVKYEVVRAHSAMKRARDVSEALGLTDSVDEVIGHLDRLQAVLDE